MKFFELNFRNAILISAHAFLACIILSDFICLNRLHLRGAYDIHNKRLKLCWNRKQPAQISHRKKCAKIESNKNENENKLISLEPVHAFIPDNQNITKYNIINREKKTKHRNNRNPIIIKCYFLNETHWNPFFSRFMNFHKRINNINFDFNMTLSPECGHELAPIFGSNMDNSIYTETKQKPAEHFFWWP